MVLFHEKISVELEDIWSTILSEHGALSTPLYLEALEKRYGSSAHGAIAALDFQRVRLRIRTLPINRSQLDLLCNLIGIRPSGELLSRARSRETDRSYTNYEAAYDFMDAMRDKVVMVGGAIAQPEFDFEDFERTYPERITSERIDINWAARADDPDFTSSQ
jgi:hypothetical protein